MTLHLILKTTTEWLKDRWQVLHGHAMQEGMIHAGESQTVWDLQSTQFMAYELFIFGIFHVIVLDYGLTMGKLQLRDYCMSPYLSSDPFPIKWRVRKEEAKHEFLLMFPSLPVHWTRVDFTLDGGTLPTVPRLSSNFTMHSCRKPLLFAWSFHTRWSPLLNNV
jgi:hypothetical protein